MMFLTRLKYWRKLRGYTLMDLAEKTGVGFTTISFLENKHRSPNPSTATKLAAALNVEVADLYKERTEQIPLIPAILNDKKTIKSNKPPRLRAKKQTVPVNGWWVIDEDDTLGPLGQVEAERLKGKLGRARVYEAASRAEADKQHISFLREVARGHDTW